VKKDIDRWFIRQWFLTHLRCDHMQMRCDQTHIRCAEAQVRCDQTHISCDQVQVKCDQTQVSRDPYIVAWLKVPMRYYQIQPFLILRLLPRNYFLFT
jgi:hypothetical protein